MANTSFENAIRSYLEDRAKTDSLFAETYNKEGKSIKECCDYIISQARKQGGSTVVVDDNTVYGWAVHYYDEDGIEVTTVKEHVEVGPCASMTEGIRSTVSESRPKKKRKDVNGDERQLSLFGDL